MLIRRPRSGGGRIAARCPGDDAPGDDALPARLPELPALFSPCRRYRYWLARDIGGAHGPALFILHSPSTADATRDDRKRPLRATVGLA